LGVPEDVTSALFRATTAPPGTEPPTRRLLTQFALVCLVARAALQVVGMASVHHTYGDAGHQWLDMWSHWDAPHYLRIADIGYVDHPVGSPDTLLVAFFPGFPALVRVVHVLTGDYLVAGLLVSYAASVGACWFLYRLVRLSADHGTAWRAVILMIAAPTAYVLSAPYTEALFLCSVLASVYYARTGRFARAGLAGAVAGATRVVGFALWPLLALEVWRRGGTPAGRLRNLAWVATSAVGLAAFLWVNQIVYGSPTQFVTTQKDHWDQGLAWPWEPIRDAWETLGRTDGDLHFIMWTRLVAFVLTAAVLVAGRKRLPLPDQVYAWITFGFVLSSVWLLSLPRYVLVIYPLFVAGAGWTRRRGVFVPVVACSAAVQGWWFWRYTGGVWAF
jgi:uncharacterized membrane protein